MKYCERFTYKRRIEIAVNAGISNESLPIGLPFSREERTSTKVDKRSCRVRPSDQCFCFREGVGAESNDTSAQEIDVEGSVMAPVSHGIELRGACFRDGRLSKMLNLGLYWFVVYSQFRSHELLAS